MRTRKPPQKTDARFERSRAMLHGAVLLLAQDESIASLTASEIAAKAGIHRSTFYQHAESPEALLREALRTELDTVRREFLGEIPADAEVSVVFQSVTRAVLQHVLHHSAIYRRSFETSADPAGLALMLTDHFEKSATDLAATTVIRLEALEDQHDRIALRYLASGAVGAIQAWLRAEPRQSPEQFATLLLKMQPSWWQAPDAAGRAAGARPEREAQA